jgi:hypothetical protein
VHFTVAGTLRMLNMGILPEDSTIELLNGTLVYRDRFDIRGGEIAEGIEGQYIIINLRNRTAEVYGDPDSAGGTYPPTADHRGK